MLKAQIEMAGSMKDQMDNLGREMKTLRIILTNAKNKNHRNRGKESLQ